VVQAALVALAWLDREHAAVYFGGSTMGFHCTLTMYPEIGAGAVVMANGEDGVSQSIRTARAPGAQRIG